MEALTTYPSFRILKGPGQRDLEMAFIARNLGATARFTILVDQWDIQVPLRILNFELVTCHGPIYKIGGVPVGLSDSDKSYLPPFNFLFVDYNEKERSGSMEFSNGG